MAAAATRHLPGRKRAWRLIPAVLVVAILGVGGACLVSAVQKARNAARASTTL
jgi:hypothetical protein